MAVAFAESLGTYIRAGYPLLYVVTAEEDRATELVAQAIAEGELARRKLFIWSVSRGLCTPDLKVVERKTADPQHILPFLLEFNEPGSSFWRTFIPFSTTALPARHWPSGNCATWWLPSRPAARPWCCCHRCSRSRQSWKKILP